MNTFKRFLVLFVAAFCMLGLNADLARAATVDITIDDTGFHPSAIINIHKGDTVRWTNTGTVVRNVTSGYTNNVPGFHPDGFIDSGPIAPGAAFEQTFTFHGAFRIYDRYDTAAGTAGGNLVFVDNLVFISPESSNFSSAQGFDLAFHLHNNGQGLQGLSQCSIFFDGVELGSCSDILTSPNFRQFGYTYMLASPVQLPRGFYSLSIKGVTSDGQAFSDTAWYTVSDPGIICGARGC